MDKPRSCTKCGSLRIAEIYYGYPVRSKGLEEKVRRFEIILGGCEPADAIWECVDCGAQYGSYNKQSSQEGA